MVQMVNPQTKGKRGENQVKTQYLDHLGIRLKRDLEQYRAADHGDLLPDFQDGDFDWPFCIEVKTYGQRLTSIALPGGSKYAKRQSHKSSYLCFGINMTAAIGALSCI